MPGGEQPQWSWVSSGHCLWGPAAPGLSPGLPVPSCLPPRAEAVGPVPASLSSTTGGAVWVGCVRDISRHTHRACWEGGSPVPTHPSSQPSSPFPPLQLQSGQQHLHPEQVTCPPARGWVSPAPGCDPQLDGRGSLLGCEAPRRRHWGGGGRVGEVCNFLSRVEASPLLTPGVLHPLLP